VAGPSSRVVIATRCVSTAKCTTARLPSVTLLGSRSRRYWAIACSTSCPVSWFFSSAVATGMPLTNSTRSSAASDPCSYRSCRVTVSRLAAYRSPSSSVSTSGLPSPARSCILTGGETVSATIRHTTSRLITVSWNIAYGKNGFPRSLTSRL